MGIRATLSASDRERVVSRFNDSDARNVQILATSTRISATAYNLWQCCFDLVFFDVPSNARPSFRLGGASSVLASSTECTSTPPLSTTPITRVTVQYDEEDNGHHR